MLKWKGLAGLSLLTIAGTGYHQYHNNHSFRSICNLVYAGAHMTYIYKFTQHAIEEKN